MCKVYITYENSTRGPVTGVYATKKLAIKERDKRHGLDCIDEFEVKGYNGYKYETPIFEDCAFYSPHLNTIRELISCLYNLEGCCTAGLGHVVIDDNNIESPDIERVLKLCDEEENKDREEVGLVKLICEELLKLSMQERVLLFSSYYGHLLCDNKCENCNIYKGELIDY